MKFGMFLCEERRNTLSDSSVVEGICATSAKGGASELGLFTCGLAPTAWQFEQCSSARRAPGAGSAPCAIAEIPADEIPVRKAKVDTSASFIGMLPDYSPPFKSSGRGCSMML